MFYGPPYTQVLHISSHQNHAISPQKFETTNLTSTQAACHLLVFTKHYIL